MKRHRALVALSRDHHQTLVVAQRLRRAESGTAAEAIAAFRDWWEPGARRHFHVEEDVLLPALARRADPRQEAIVQMLLDHVVIRRDAAALGEGSPLELLHDLGARLAEHVRLEERQVFPLVESSLSEEELDALGAALARAGV